MKIQNFKRSLFAVIFGLFFIIPIIPIISANQDIKNSAIVPYNSQWLTNSNFDTASNWVFTLDSDSPLDDIEDSITEGKANMKVIGESYSERVTLNSTTYTQWESFNKTSLVILPDDGFGVDQYGAWCSHTWHEDEGEQPENTPRIHWRYNVSLPVDMSDYQITSASLVAEINASVDLNIDCPGDLEARNGVNINQYEIYDWAQFYIEVSTQDIDEINTYRIAFNQTFDLGEG
ncbi:MAG: hypothetical protein JXA99_14200, partial [Candidatus Lokiarchaeota archaeon]|nr:hypothetical protein [Candidatus Lokiarchaeota archaeon]